MSVKFPFFGGVLGGGGSADFIFMGARIFLKKEKKRYPDLLFLAFLENGKETTKTARISFPGRTPKILGKEANNAQNRKEFLEKDRGKEIQKKNKERKIRVFS